MRADVALIDSGGANLNSIRFAFEEIGVTVRLANDPQSIETASHVVLPGVGAAKPAMSRLHELQLVPILRKLSQPVLGICLGMQLLFDRSAEGSVDCLGVIPGQVERLTVSPPLMCPHTGWNRNHWLPLAAEHTLARNVASGFYAYFVHSYAAPMGSWTLASCAHGGRFSSIVGHANYLGIQFHPERSGPIGKQLLANFLNWSPQGSTGG